MERIALKCTNNIRKYTNKTELELKKIKYGIEVMLINISKLVVILIASYFLKTMLHTLIIMISFGLLRKNAFGLHAKNGMVCTVVSTVFFIGGSYIGNHYSLEKRFIVLIFLISIGLIIKYAPADTEARPLIGKRLRSKLKRNTVIMTLLLFVITLIVNNPIISTLIALGVIMECISILPISYKTLNRRYNNYEKYK